MGEKIEYVKRKMRPIMKAVDYISKRRDAGYNDDEEFIPDATPIAPPVGYKKQPSMVEVVRAMVRDAQLQADLEAAGVETFEEADNFDVGDENAQELRSGFENDFDPPIKEMVAEGEKEIRRKREVAEKARAAAEAATQGDG